MARNTTHTQCKLRKGNAEQVSWIPSIHAVVGKYVKLRRKTGNTEMSGPFEPPSEEHDTHTEWDDGWQVVETWSSRDTKYVQERSHEHTKLPSLDKQRKRKKKGR